MAYWLCIPERPETGCPCCWLLKLRQRETYGVEMKGVPSLVGSLGSSCQFKSTKYYFPRRTLFFFLYVSPSRSNLGSQSWLVACLFVCVSGEPKKIERKIILPYSLLRPNQISRWFFTRYCTFVRPLAHTWGTGEILYITRICVTYMFKCNTLVTEKTGWLTITESKSIYENNENSSMSCPWTDVNTDTVHTMQHTLEFCIIQNGPKSEKPYTTACTDILKKIKNFCF
jgi:hypothetical protein